MPLCSIIIPCFNNAALTRQCLDAVLSKPGAVEFEVIAVDNGSRDGTRAMLESYGKRIRVVTHDENLFFANACNRGAEIAIGQFLVFLNNDTVAHAGWLDALVRYAELHPKAGVVAPKLLYPNNSVQHAGVAVCQDLYPRHIYVGFPADHPAVCKSRKFQFVTGACMLIDRDVFQSAGGFCADYVNGFEDMELCVRVRELDREIHLCHESVLYHFESVSENRGKFDDQNAALFWKRWHARLVPDDLSFYIADGLLRVANHISGIEIDVAPELGVICCAGRENGVQRLLTRRAREVWALLRENMLLRAAATEPPRQA